MTQKVSYFLLCNIYVMQVGQMIIFKINTNCFIDGTSYIDNHMHCFLIQVLEIQ